MGVVFMDAVYSENTIVENAMKWIRHLLEKNYHLKAVEAEKAIKDSGVINAYSSDIEMSSHDSIEEWTKTVYGFYLKSKKG